MFKAIKGKAAGALDAATTSANKQSDKGGGNVKELESKLKSMEKERDSMNETIRKMTTKMAKLETTEQRLMGDMQRKDAEVNRVNKQLEKMKKEGGGLETQLDAAMADTKQLLADTQEKLQTSEEENVKYKEDLEQMANQLVEQQKFAAASEQLTKELDVQQKAIFVQEEKFKGRILTLKKQLEVAERKVMNAKYLSESHETLSAESQMYFLHSENQKCEVDRRLQRSLERYSALEHNLQLTRLTNMCQTGKTEIKETEQSIRECYSDPLLQVPAGTAKRRQLKKLEQKLKSLRLNQKSQSSFLSQITQIGDLNDELRSAANNNDIMAVKRLMKQGCPCNIPDETGFSAFKYACGQGNLEIIEIMLDYADIQDEDGLFTSLILAAKMAKDEVVNLLVKRGAKIDATDQSGRTALHVASVHGNRSTVLELLDLGANVNALDKKGCTALHHCATYNMAPIARLLLDRGVNENAINVDTLTAFKIAMEQKHQRLVEVLSEHKIAKKNAQLHADRVAIDAAGFEKMMSLASNE